MRRIENMNTKPAEKMIHRIKTIEEDEQWIKTQKAQHDQNPSSFCQNSGTGPVLFWVSAVVENPNKPSFMEH